ncbi:MAG: alpha/beta hydrolase [Gemmatimonadales bacterium]
MATPTLTRHRVPGVLGEISVDVRAGGRSSPRPAVVAAHGFKGFKEWGMWPPFADRLARAGFTSVSLNFSGSGVDHAGSFAHADRFAHNTFSAEFEDLKRVVAALHGGELEVAAPSSLGLVGHSRGGGVAILYTARDPRVRALATWAAISTVERWQPAEKKRWRESGVHDVRNARTGEVLPLYTDILDDIDRNRTALDIEAAAGRISVPWLLLHGTDDEAVSLAEGELLAALGRRPGTSFLAIEGAGHTFGAAHPWAGTTPALEVVFDTTLAFFATELR